MKLYEINFAIDSLLAQLEPDENTGEIKGNVDAIIDTLDKFEMEKKEILSYLAKLIFNHRSDISSLKEEENRLKTRRLCLEKKEKAILDILDRECAGQKTDLGIATFSYRRNKKVEVNDLYKAVSWLRLNGHFNSVRQADPEISKTDVRRLIEKGAVVPGAQLVESITYSLR